MSEEKQQTTAVQTAVAVRNFLALDQYKSRFKEVMDKRAPQFMASICNLSSQLPQDTDPKSIIACCFKAATLDFPVDKNLGYAWVVPYREKGKMMAQLQIGWKGYVSLAIRTGLYRHINACAIPQKVFVSYNPLSGELVLDWTKADISDQTVGYAAFIELTTGYKHTIYWTTEHVRAHAKRYSKAFNSGPWQSNFDEMACKTVVKMLLSRWGILSIEMREAVKFDQSTIKDIDAEPTYSDGALDGDSSIPSAKPIDVESTPVDEPAGTDESKQEPTGTQPEKAAPVTPPVATIDVEALKQSLSNDCVKSKVTEEQVCKYVELVYKKPLPASINEIGEKYPKLLKNIAENFAKHLDLIKNPAKD